MATAMCYILNNKHITQYILYSLPLISRRVVWDKESTRILLAPAHHTELTK